MCNFLYLSHNIPQNMIFLKEDEKKKKKKMQKRHSFLNGTV